MPEWLAWDLAITFAVFVGMVAVWFAYEIRHAAGEELPPPAPVYPLDLYRSRKLRADCPRREESRRDGGRVVSPNGRPRASWRTPGRPAGTTTDGDAA